MYYTVLKRVFDFFFAILLGTVFFPFAVIIAILIKLESRGPVFFRQARTGRHEQPFYIIKFRSMRQDETGLNITICGDDRITPLGRILRKTKLDEIPQLLNILKGDMSLVGPRPEVTSHLPHYDIETRKIIFSARPGITDLASLLYIHEERLLAESNDPLKTYFEIILPEKNRLRVLHLVQNSLLFDMKILIWTGLKIILRKHLPAIKCPSTPVQNNASSEILMHENSEILMHENPSITKDAT